MTKYSESSYPYYCWIRNHTRVYNYKPGFPYHKNALVLIDKGIYRSMKSRNKSIPTTLINWIKLK